MENESIKDVAEAVGVPAATILKMNKELYHRANPQDPPMTLKSRFKEGTLLYYNKPRAISSKLSRVYCAYDGCEYDARKSACYRHKLMHI